VIFREKTSLAWRKNRESHAGGTENKEFRWKIADQKETYRVNPWEATFKVSVNRWKSPIRLGKKANEYRGKATKEEKKKWTLGLWIMTSSPNKKGAKALKGEEVQPQATNEGAPASGTKKKE